MPLQATSGAASYDGFGGGVAVVPNYIEDVFSTWLYTGNDSTQTITNGIDLSTKGGLVWQKGRETQTFTSHNLLTDTARGVSKALRSNDTVGQQTVDSVTAFNTTGFTVGADSTINQNTKKYVSWTFREQPKFFDVVTYTGDGLTGKVISHSLGSTPGCIIFKRTDSTSDWAVYHRSLNGGVGPEDYRVFLNTTAAQTAGPSYTVASVSSASFTLGSNGAGGGSALTNVSGATYVAYVFAHNAGGFGLTGTDNVISCSSYTGNGSTTGPIIDLGYEPQWLMIKNANGTSNEDWVIVDNIRGLTSFNNPTTNTATLKPNTTAVEVATSRVKILNTGFQITNGSADLNENTKNYIYVAIRRGPMKVPTDATKVFGLSARSGTGANATVTGGQTDDVFLVKNRNTTASTLLASRQTGTGYLVLHTTAAEVAAGATLLQTNPWDVMDGIKIGTTAAIVNASGGSYINYLFKRAPSFMDVVCYTGNGSNPRTINHNLGVVPELMIVKSRSAVEDWSVYCAYMSTPETSVLFLNLTDPQDAGTSRWNNTLPTSTVFNLSGLNTNNVTYINYLFASCAGVSKVGSYTGNGSTQTINCGFTAGARFVLIKRTDLTGDWYVYDTARGMSTLTDPYWRTNSTTAEAATLGSVTTVTTGFALDSSILAAINVSGGTYIFLAIA